MQNTRYDIDLTSRDTSGRLTGLQLRQLQSFGARINKFGFNFAVCSANAELVLLCEGGKFKSDQRLIIDNCSSILEKETGDHQASTVDGHFPSAVLKRGEQIVAVALIDLDDSSLCAMHDDGRDRQYHIPDRGDKTRDGRLGLLSGDGG